MPRKTRKWTATVEVAGQDYTHELELTHDTLNDVTSAAVLLATRLIRVEELGSDASVVLYKQLARDDEPVRDRSVYVYRDWDSNGDAVVRVQQSGA
jgi:hypothetical protein